MKAFLFDLIGKARRTSQSLDIKAILCNKVWRAFTDTDEKEVHIFMEDGSLVISQDGVVEMGKWQFIPANQSLVITGNGQTLLVYPVVCNNVLVLVQDGKNLCSFLLDDTKAELERLKTLAGLQSYLSQNINKVPEAPKNYQQVPPAGGSYSAPFQSDPVHVKSDKEWEQEISYPRNYMSEAYTAIKGFCEEPVVTDSGLRIQLGRTLFDSTFLYNGFRLTGLIHDVARQRWFVHVRLGKVLFVYTKYDDEKRSLAKCYYIDPHRGTAIQFSQYEPDDTNWSSLKYVVRQGRLSYRDYPIASVETELRGIRVMRDYRSGNK